MALFAMTLLASTAPATITVYCDANEFMNAIPSPGYFTAYWDTLNGEKDYVAQLNDGEYAFHAHADNGLRSEFGGSALSTCDATDLLQFTFENSPEEVHSVGGIFASTDYMGNPTGQELDIVVEDILHSTVTVPIWGSCFVGFVSDIPLALLTLDSVDDWPQVTIFHADSPEPATLVLLALGGCTLLKKRRA